MPPDALVIRFRPTNPEDVFNWAEKEHRRRRDPEHPEQTFYRISVFADVKRDGESDDDLLRRLIEASGLDLGKNKYCWTTRSERLQDLGLTFWKDGDADEVEEHYSLDLGSSPTVEDVGRMLEVFEGPERTRS